MNLQDIRRILIPFLIPEVVCDLSATLAEVRHFVLAAEAAAAHYVFFHCVGDITSCPHHISGICKPIWMKPTPLGQKLNVDYIFITSRSATPLLVGVKGVWHLVGVALAISAIY